MATFKIFKETTLPGTLQPNAIYLIAPAANPDLVEIVVTNTAGSAPHRRVINRADVQGMIDSSLSSLSELRIVADIAARNALTPTKALYVYVENATGDPTVASGGATYLYKTSNSTWIKVSEAESLDVALNWSSIVGRPSSSAAAIDAAVGASHTHANKTQLDLIGQNAQGEMTYNGTQVKTEWASASW